MTTPPGGPSRPPRASRTIPAVARFKIYQAKPVRKLDPSFGIETETFAERYRTAVGYRAEEGRAAGPADITAKVRYQCCNDTICLPPKRKSAIGRNHDRSVGEGGSDSIPAGYTLAPSAAAAAPSTASVAPAAPAAPVQPASDLGLFLLTAFGAGLAAIFTPCVFPMIPFTVSYFLNRQTGNKRDGVLHAVIFCLGIVVLFTGLGALLKAIAGPFGVVQLGNSPWVNGFIALVFIVFGLSLLGAYRVDLAFGLADETESGIAKAAAIWARCSWG